MRVQDQGFQDLQHVVLRLNGFVNKLRHYHTWTPIYDMTKGALTLIRLSGQQETQRQLPGVTACGHGCAGQKSAALPSSTLPSWAQPGCLLHVRSKYDTYVR
jgi:hypothetical protein